MIRATIVAGNQPRKQRSKTSRMILIPLSNTASGGRIMHRMILRISSPELILMVAVPFFVF
jgi:hypothetical protein